MPCNSNNVKKNWQRFGPKHWAAKCRNWSFRLVSFSSFCRYFGVFSTLPVVESNKCSLRTEDVGGLHWRGRKIDCGQSIWEIEKRRAESVVKDRLFNVKWYLQHIFSFLQLDCIAFIKKCSYPAVLVWSNPHHLKVATNNWKNNWSCN